MKTFCIWIVLAYFIASGSTASATPESRAAVLFLLIEPGARHIAMGEAGTAIANDGATAYFNPAGIVNPGVSGNLTYSKWLPGLADDLSFLHGALSVSPEKLFGKKDTGMGVGLSFSLLNLGEQTRTDERGNAQGTFRSYDIMLGATGAIPIGESKSVGATIKYIRSNLADQGAGIERGKGVGNSFAVDVGFLWQGIGSELFVPFQDGLSFFEEHQRKLLTNRPPPGFSVGMKLSNIGPKIAYIDASQADPLPMNLVLGFGGIFDTDLVGVQCALDIYKPLISDGSSLSSLYRAWSDDPLSDEFKEIDIHVGLEVTALALVAVRAGYSSDRDGELNTLTWGLGLGPETARLNIAYVSGEDTPMQDNWRLSLDIAAF